MPSGLKADAGTFFFWYLTFWLYITFSTYFGFMMGVILPNAVWLALFEKKYDA